MPYARIIGTGGYLPEKVLTNADLENMVETSDEWIVTRTGIRERHIAAEGETTCDMAEHAARAAMDSAGITVAAWIVSNGSGTIIKLPVTHKVGWDAARQTED